MQKVIVLGANGYLGSNICQALKDAGHFVIGVGRDKKHCTYIDIYLQLDLSEPTSIRVIGAQEYDTVIDLVSYVPPNDRSIKMDNVKPTLKTYTELIRTCFFDKKYIFISSGGTIYGNVNHPCNEEQPLNPLTPYALQKVYQEEIIQRYIARHIILRVSNPYGGNQVVKNGVGFIAYLIECARKKSDITITVPENTIRDYLLLDDFLNSIMFFLKKNLHPNKVYNVSTGVGHTLYELTSIVILALEEKITYKTNLVNFVESEHILFNVLDNKKLISETGIKLTSHVHSYLIQKLLN